VDSAAILTCWSQEATKSSWVAAEASHANDRKALVSAVLEPCKIPAPFNAVESSDLVKWHGDLDAPSWRDIVRKLRELVHFRDGVSEPEEAAAPAPRQAAAPPAQQAAQVVAPSAFFSQNLGMPHGAAARTAPRPAPPPQPQPPRSFQPIDAPPPAPPAKPPRVVLPPMDPPAPSPRAREQQPRPVRPVEEPPSARSQPRPVRPVEEAPPTRPAPRAPARPASDAQAPTPGLRPGPRVVQPVDEPAPAAARAPQTPRQAPPGRKPGPAQPSRPYTPVDETPARRRGGPGFVQFLMIGAIAAVVVAGVIWGGERFLSAPSAPKLAQDQEAAAPEPLPTEAGSDTQLAETPTAPEALIPPEIETAPLAPPETAPPANQPKARPQEQKTAAALRPTTQPPALSPPPPRPAQPKLATPPPPRPAQPPATTRPETRPAQPKLASATPPRTPTQPPPAGTRTPAIVLPQPSLNTGDASASSASADATRDLERCLGRLVRLCPSGSGGRPGFTEDGVLSSGERALLNQRSLFAWSDAVSSNVANCSRHLNAAVQAGQSRPYEPLASACRGLPTSGPPR
jgi:hypothetical protein